MPTMPTPPNPNEARQQIQAPKAGQPIRASFLESVARSVNERRGVTNPPSQIITAKGGAAALTIVARVATSNIALTGTISIDGANATNGTLVLATAQSTASQNGVWLVSTSGAWTSNGRSAQVWATAGTLYTNTMWALTTTNTYKILVGAYG